MKTVKENDEASPRIYHNAVFWGYPGEDYELSGGHGNVGRVFYCDYREFT